MKCELCGAEWLDQSRLGNICFVHLGHTNCPLVLTQAMSTGMVEAINAAIEAAKVQRVTLGEIKVFPKALSAEEVVAKGGLRLRRCSGKE